MGRDSPLGMNTSSYRLDPSDLASYTEKKCFFGRLEDFWNNGRAVGVLDSAWEQHTFMDGQASPRGNEEEGCALVAAGCPETAWCTPQPDSGPSHSTSQCGTGSAAVMPKKKTQLWEAQETRS